ncbi:MAG: DMT family transporter [Acidobacteriales bacterium]|nr:DMT family transporter [Terriglobales bacterium]
MTAGRLKTRRWQAELALVLIALIWGSTFVVVKQALESVSTLLFLALRFGLASVALLVAFRRLRPALFEQKRLLAGGVLAGVCLFGGYVFQTVGLRSTTPSKSAFITGLSVVLVPLLSSLVYRNAPQVDELLGVLLAAFGLALMTLNEESLTISSGDALTVLSAFGFAIHIMVLGHYTRAGGFEALSVIQIATCALISLSTFWWVETPYVAWSPSLLAALAITGLLATALAFTVMTWAQQHTTATRTALFLVLEPVFAALTSFVVEGEVFTPRGGVGAALILAGIVMVDLKPFSRPSHP